MAALAALAPIAAIASTALTAVGTIAAGQAYAERGKAEQKVAEWQAKQMEVQAKNEQAMGQREAEQYGRQKRLALSTLQARTAASGFSATDPTSLSIADEISRYGTLQEQTALYGGEERRRELETGAAGKRFSGAMAAATGEAYKTASYLSAGGTILGGLSGFAGRYGGTQFDPFRMNGGPLVINRYGALRYG